MSAFVQEADTLDIDRYLNLDQGYLSRSSSSASIRGKGIASPLFRVPAPHTALVPSQPASQPIFSGPSHQYDQFRQHSAFAPGALANTLAASQANCFHAQGIPQQYGMGSSSIPLLDVNSPEEDFDFSAMNNDIDMDFDPSFDGLFNSGYIDPNVVGGHGQPSPVPAPVQRLWPGMHQQQAEAAKAQQQQQAQTVAAPADHLPDHGRRPSSGKEKDPVVEERISRLLNQMRHSSVASSASDTTAAVPRTQSARARKDEEDMDEDERLLASEEGKKLSSKERRQLRNKVSARAFRSRRKEYIGQLEGEIAAKSQEADDLRDENDALKAENIRLTDLTRMLLSSPAFSTFLNDLSATGAPVTVPSSRPAFQPTQAPKDASPHRQQEDAQVNLAMIPETTLDFASFQVPQNPWGSGVDFSFNTQAFAVRELPEGPPIDTNTLSGKATSTAVPFSGCEAKEERPLIERMPVLEKPVQVRPQQAEPCDDPDFDVSDPAFALFFSHSPSRTTAAPTAAEQEYQVFGSVAPEKALACYDLVVDTGSGDGHGTVSSAVMLRFEALCSSLHALSASVGCMTSRL